MTDTLGHWYIEDDHWAELQALAASDSAVHRTEAISIVDPDGAQHPILEFHGPLLVRREYQGPGAALEFSGSRQSLRCRLFGVTGAIRMKESGDDSGLELSVGDTFFLHVGDAESDRSSAPAPLHCALGGDLAGWVHSGSESLQGLHLIGPTCPDIAGLGLPTGLRQITIVAPPTSELLEWISANEQLEALDLRDVSTVSDIGFLARLPRLEELGLQSALRIADATPLAALSRLRRLRLTNASVPDLEPLAGLTGLTSLNLWSCKQVTDLGPLAGLTGLTSLDLKSCEQVTDLAPLAGLTGLTSLNLVSCEQVTDLAPLAGLTGLTSLNLVSCEQVTDLAPLAGLTGLTSLNLVSCEQVTDLAPLAGLTGLTSLDLWSCNQVTDLAPLAGLTGLTSLDLRSCEQVTDLAPLAGLTGLTSLQLSFCKQVTDLAPLAGLTGLTSLQLSFCKQVTDLGPLAGLTGLTSLSLASCEQVTDLAPLAGLTGLTSLQLSFCKQVTDLAPLAGLTGLTSLNLASCEQVTDLAPLAGLTGLTSLDLWYCNQVTDLAPLAGLTGLTSLNLASCEQVTDLAPLAGLTGLTSLDLRSCEQVTDLAPLAGLTGLTSLQLSFCKRVTDLAPLAGFTGLTSLNLASCEQVTDLAPLAGLTGLTSLDLSSCERVTDLAPLAGLTGLTSLNLASCEQVTDLAPLAGMSALQSLSIQGCRRLTQVAAVVALPELAGLQVGGCPYLRDLPSLGSAPALTDLQCDDEVARAEVELGWAQRRGWRPDDPARDGAWVELIGLAKEPNTLAIALARFCRQGAIPENLLAQLITQARTRADVSAVAWEEVFRTLLDSEADQRQALFTASLTGLDLPQDLDRMLVPGLAALSRLPHTEHGWVRTLARTILAPVPEGPAARQVAPAAALLYAKLGDGVEVQWWLERATAPEQPVWRDRVLVALAGWDLERDDVTTARRRLAEVLTPRQRDEGRGLLARYLAARAPAAAVTELSAIEDRALRAAVARGLVNSAGLTGTAAGIYGLLLALEAEPEALAEVVEAVLRDHPDSALAASVARTFAPRTLDGLVDAAQLILNHPAIRKATIPEECDAMAQRLVTEPELLRSALGRGILQLLVEAEALKASRVPGVLEALSRDA